jgi:hypothetical protein
MSTDIGKQTCLAFPASKHGGLITFVRHTALQGAEPVEPPAAHAAASWPAQSNTSLAAGAALPQDATAGTPGSAAGLGTQQRATPEEG